MENLRETLKLLFLRRSGKEVVANISNGKPSMTREIDLLWFVHDFPPSIASYSYAQKEQIYRLMCEKWMCGNEYDLCCCKTPTIFNILHHFTGQCLKEEGGKLMCIYDSLLRWHDLSSQLTEDLLITSYLAARDMKTGFKRMDFAWQPVIGHDNDALNALFSKPMADLHFHLLGSSNHFSLSWLAVMNNPAKAKKLYQKQDVWYPRKGEGANRYINLDDLFILMIKACAIRRFLFRYLKGTIEPKEHDALIGVLGQDQRGEDDKENEEEGGQQATGIMSVIKDIENSLKSETDYAYNYFHDASAEGVLIDYAITKDLIVIDKSDKRYIYTVLAGERKLLYSLFQKIYQDDGERIGQIEMLFYAYLVIKGLVRHEMVQLNHEIGLSNFIEYDDRKLELSTNKYSNLMKQIAIRSFCCQNKDNYLEVRIIPRDEVKEVKKAIRDIEKSVGNPFFCHDQEGQKLNYWYVLHFVKEKDVTSKEKLESSCRHGELREKLKKEAKASYEWKYTGENDDPNRIVGIDAANAECSCRPEVFAQVFRYLRHEKTLESKPEIKPFKFTYHVGEDFYDIVDGLRAIDEVRAFLEFGEGDRLGHALALGIDVERYYQQCNYTIVQQKQTILDNLAWLLVKGEGNAHYEDVKENLIAVFMKYSSYVYGVSEPSYKDYFDSWYLRGDDPNGYMTLKDGHPQWADTGSLFGYETLAGERAGRARNNPKACELNHLYHFDAGVKTRGSEADELKITYGMVMLIKEVQKQMLSEIEALHVGIECCPTSNVRIGPIRKYRDHPIFRFNNEGLEFEGKMAVKNLPVSINTDDKGIFATSLEREYSLLGSALEKDRDKGYFPHNSAEKIYGWLDKIRELGLAQKFGGD